MIPYDNLDPMYWIEQTRFAPEFMLDYTHDKEAMECPKTLLSPPPPTSFEVNEDYDRFLEHYQAPRATDTRLLTLFGRDNYKLFKRNKDNIHRHFMQKAIEHYVASGVKVPKSYVEDMGNPKTKAEHISQAETSYALRSGKLDKAFCYIPKCRDLFPKSDKGFILSHFFAFCYNQHRLPTRAKLKRDTELFREVSGKGKTNSWDQDFPRMLRDLGLLPKTKSK